jgi:HK97 family phage prohead protease
MKTKMVEPGAREQRAAVLDDLEFRGADEDGKLQFRGHAAVFDEWAQIGDPQWGFMERVKRGAFRKVLAAGADVRFLINHDGLPLARTASGTMKLKEDSRGLLVDAELAPTTLAQDLSVLVARGDVSQMSFGFRVGKHEIEEDEDEGIVKRTITEFSELYDVSPVTFPAYEGTDAGMRAAALEELRAAVQTSPDLAAVFASSDSAALKSFLADLLPEGRSAEEKPASGLTVARARLVLAELG